MSYMTISSQKNHHFSLCSYFHAHPTTLLLKILGDQCMGRPPTSNFGGDRPPPPPPRSPPLLDTPSTTVRDLGGLLESDLCMRRHVAWTVGCCFRQLRLIRSCIKSLPLWAAKVAVTAFVTL